MNSKPIADVRPATATPRALGVAWLLLGAPLLVATGPLLLARPPEPWLVARETVQLPGPILWLAATQDRVGYHVAATTEGCRLFVITADQGRLQARELSTSWVPNRERRLRLVLADTNQDDLTDICAVQRTRSSRPSGFMPSWTGDGWVCGMYVQRRGQYQFTAVGDRAPVVSAGPVRERVYAGGETLAARIVHQSTSQSFTRLCRDDDERRVRHVLRGELALVLDINADGQQDVVTSEWLDPDTPEIHWRLYVYEGGRYQEVWNHATRHVIDPRAGLNRGPAFIESGDLDGDGYTELLLCEPQTGRLTAWHLDPSRLP